MFTDKEQKLIELLSLSQEKSLDGYILKDRKGKEVGKIHEDLNKNERVFEFIKKDKRGKNVSIYLKIGEIIKLGFLPEAGQIRSFSLSNDALELIIPFQTEYNRGHEHILIKKDPSTSLGNYLGTNYVYQKEIVKDDEVVRTYFDYQVSPNSFYQLNLNYKCNDVNVTESVPETPIRRIVKSDKSGIESFANFRKYANEFLGLPCDIMELLMSENIKRNDVFVTYIPDLQKHSKVPDFNLLRELGPNILFGIIYENRGNSLVAHGVLVYDLEKCYDFGYIESNRKSSFFFHEQYIFKLNKRGKVEMAFDFLNKIEILGDDKERLYKELTKAKTFSFRKKK